MVSEDRQIEVVESVVDFANAVEAACVNLRLQVEGKQKVERKVWSWNPGKIKWQLAEGMKGQYDRSEDVNSLEFKAMVKDLVRHKGKLRRGRHFYWIFKNGSIVGRKIVNNNRKGIVRT